MGSILRAEFSSLRFHALFPAPTEEAACIAQNLRTDEGVGIGAHDDGSGLAAWGPATTLPGGVLRGMPGMASERCCRFACRASAGDEESIPRPTAKATHPTER